MTTIEIPLASRELMRRAADILGSQGFAAWDALAAEIRADIAAPAETPAPARVVMPPFAETVLAKLDRIDECFSDGQRADVEREWFDALTLLGLLTRVQVRPAFWSITPQGEAALARLNASPAEQQAEQPEFCCELSYKAAKQVAWGARDLTRCKCDHNEHCEHCWPDDFKEGGKWQKGFKASPARQHTEQQLCAKIEVRRDSEGRLSAKVCAFEASLLPVGQMVGVYAAQRTGGAE